MKYLGSTFIFQNELNTSSTRWTLGYCVLDSQGKVLSFNKVFSHILEIDPNSNEINFFEIIKNQNWREAFDVVWESCQKKSQTEVWGRVEGSEDECFQVTVKKSAQEDSTYYFEIMVPESRVWIRCEIESVKRVLKYNQESDKKGLIERNLMTGKIEGVNNELFEIFGLNREQYKSNTFTGLDEAMFSFYEILFKDYPQSRELFKDVDMNKQKKSLLGSLVFVVDHLDNQKSLYDFLYKMGQRHSDYGTQEEHYDWVGASLIKTFEFFFKDNWTEELSAQWVSAYNVIKSIMLEGQHSKAEKVPDIRARAIEICNALLLEVLENEIDEEVILAIKSKVKHILLSSLEEETAKILKKSA